MRPAHVPADSSRYTATTITDPSAAWSLWVTIPRTEEVYELQVLGKGGARTVFVLQVNCKGAGSGISHSIGAGSTQTWQIKKRYGYFERVHKVATKCAEASGVRPPELPRRKLVGHRDPKYLRTLREQLQLYLEQVIDLVQRTTVGSLDLATVLQQLELPIASDSATWEQRSRFGVGADGKSLPIEIEGFLRKQGGSKSDVKRGWKERWFVLAGSSLHYYTQPEAPTTKGVIELQSARVEEQVLGEEAFGIIVHDKGGAQPFMHPSPAPPPTTPSLPSIGPLSRPGTWHVRLSLWRIRIIDASVTRDQAAPHFPMTFPTPPLFELVRRSCSDARGRLRRQAH